MFQRDDTEIINLVGGVWPVASWATGPCLCLENPIFRVEVQSLHIDTHQSLVPLHDVIDTVQIVLRCSYEDPLIEEVALKQVLTLRPPMGSVCADTGQVAESVRPT